MLNLLLIWGVLGSQFFFVRKWANGDELWVFYWLVLVTVCSFRCGLKRSVDMKAFFFLLLASFASMFANFFKPQQPIYFQVFLKVLLGCLTVRIIAERITLAPRKIGLWLTKMWIVIHIVLFFQILGIIFKNYELSGFYTMPWIMGCAACLSIPFFNRVKPWYSVLLVLPILFSKSNACAVVATFMWLRPRFNWKHILLAVLMIAGYVFFFDYSFSSARIIAVTKTIPHWHNWVFGDGIGAWAHKAFVIYNGKDPYYWRWAHNEFYQMLVETGFLGLSAVLYMIFNLFKGINRDQKYYLFGICSLALVHPIFHMPRLIPYLVLLFSFFVRRGIENTGRR